MPNLRETRISLLYAYDSSIYDNNTATRPLNSTTCLTRSVKRNLAFIITLAMTFSRDIYMLEWLDGRWHRGSLHLFKKICVLAVSSV